MKLTKLGASPLARGQGKPSAVWKKAIEEEQLNQKNSKPPETPVNPFEEFLRRQAENQDKIRVRSTFDRDSSDKNFKKYTDHWVLFTLAIHFLVVFAFLFFQGQVLP